MTLAVRLRLRRMGRKKRPFYRIIAADQRSPRDGRFIESVGTYNPLEQPHTIELNEERVLYWLSQGAQPSTTVNSLLRKKGILHRLDLKKRGLNEEEVGQEMQKWELLQTEKLKRRESAISQKAKTKTTPASDENTATETEPAQDAKSGQSEESAVPVSDVE